MRVAERLGLQVEQRARTPRRALCPFHKDTDPSLNLFTDRKNGRQHYHCFACAAHGDVLDLVKGVKGFGFGEAATWLCEEVGLPRPSAGATRIDQRAAQERLRELSFTAELICAEMLLHASTSNLFAVKLAIEDLRLRFGLPLKSTDKNGVLRSVLEELVAEITTYCEATAFSMRAPNFPPVLNPDADLLQRSILVIPATTSRSADYHVFGQAQHLAAGLVTVFANHCGGSACGGSAFIGLDGWQPMKQTLTLYGEIGPGIFHFERKEFGPLGERECALVIADVDPLHTTDQKPRPQYQPRPLQLVAHLPLIFETEACDDARYTKKTPGGDEKKETPPLRHENDGIAAGRRSPRDHPDGKRVVRRRDLPWDHAPDEDSTGKKPTINETQSAHTFAEAIAATWTAARAAAGDGRYRDRALDRCLRVLTRFADDPHWLDERREQLTKSPIEHPPGDPPPALVDWIYVEDGFDRATPSAVSDDPEPR